MTDSHRLTEHPFVRHPDPHFGIMLGGGCAHVADGIMCGWSERLHLTIIWERATEERYCVDSGRPVQLIPGDRCLSHGARDVMCTTATRDPRCQHPRLSRNHPYPKCEECGRAGTAAVNSPLTSEETR